MRRQKGHQDAFDITAFLKMFKVGPIEARHGMQAVAVGRDLTASQQQQQQQPFAVYSPCAVPVGQASLLFPLYMHMPTLQPQQAYPASDSADLMAHAPCLEVEMNFRPTFGIIC